MTTDWLPIGSVVLLKGGEHPIMIYGRKQKSVSRGEERIYDYTACLYPEGNIDEEYNYLFNKDQIDRLLFIGFQSPEEFTLADNLDELPISDRGEN